MCCSPRRPLDTSEEPSRTRVERSREIAEAEKAEPIASLTRTALQMMDAGIAGRYPHPRTRACPAPGGLDPGSELATCVYPDAADWLIDGCGRLLAIARLVIDAIERVGARYSIGGSLGELFALSTSSARTEIMTDVRASVSTRLPAPETSPAAPGPLRRTGRAPPHPGCT